MKITIITGDNEETVVSENNLVERIVNVVNQIDENVYEVIIKKQAQS
ncbi:MAG: hypothetical protein PUE26_07975 [Ruminococcus sp.]|nr:hypothetical protein [Ruminococcus sp.]MDD6710069.1 hypothetical protein [Ruminococcus sp.]